MSTMAVSYTHLDVYKRQECYTIIIRQSAGNINYFFLRRAVYILQAFKFPHKQVIVKTYRFQKGSMCESARSGADFMEF